MGKQHPQNAGSVGVSVCASSLLTEVLPRKCFTNSGHTQGLRAAGGFCFLWCSNCLNEGSICSLRLQRKVRVQMESIKCKLGFKLPHAERIGVPETKAAVGKRRGVPSMNIKKGR